MAGVAVHLARRKIPGPLARAWRPPRGPGGRARAGVRRLPAARRRGDRRYRARRVARALRGRDDGSGRRPDGAPDRGTNPVLDAAPDPADALSSDRFDAILDPDAGLVLSLWRQTEPPNPALPGARCRLVRIVRSYGCTTGRRRRNSTRRRRRRGKCSHPGHPPFRRFARSANRGFSGAAHPGEIRARRTISTNSIARVRISKEVATGISRECPASPGPNRPCQAPRRQGARRPDTDPSRRPEPRSSRSGDRRRAHRASTRNAPTIRAAAGSASNPRRKQNQMATAAPVARRLARRW